MQNVEPQLLYIDNTLAPGSQTFVRQRPASPVCLLEVASPCDICDPSQPHGFQDETAWVPFVTSGGTDLELPAPTTLMQPWRTRAIDSTFFTCAPVRRSKNVFGRHFIAPYEERKSAPEWFARQKQGTNCSFSGGIPEAKSDFFGTLNLEFVEVRWFFSEYVLFFQPP